MERSDTGPINTLSKKWHPSGAVLMVDALWLWILSDKTIITFAPPREPLGDKDEGSFPHTNPFKAALRYANKPNSRIQDCFDLAALLVYNCVEALLKNTTESSLKVISKFDTFTSYFVERQAEAFRNFRDNLIDKHGSPYRKALHPTLDRKRLEIDVDLQNLLELRDVSDELSIIERLLVQQGEQVDRMTKRWERVINRRRGNYGIRRLRRASMLLNTYKSAIKGLNINSNRAQEGYQVLINLKESHSSVQESQTASDQARVVNIFTLITIVFSPLSFFASIFGMVGLSTFKYGPITLDSHTRTLLKPHSSS